MMSANVSVFADLAFPLREAAAYPPRVVYRYKDDLIHSLLPRSRPRASRKTTANLLPSVAHAPGERHPTLCTIATTESSLG